MKEEFEPWECLGIECLQIHISGCRTGRELATQTRDLSTRKLEIFKTEDQKPRKSHSIFKYGDLSSRFQSAQHHENPKKSSADDKNLFYTIKSSERQKFQVWS